MNNGKTDTSDSLAIGAIVVVRVGTIHWSMAHDDDPRSDGSILNGICLSEISFKPFVLQHHLFQSVVDKIVEFSGNDDEMGRTEVETVKKAVFTSGHRETGLVVTEIVFLFVIANSSHVRHVSGDGFDLAHKTVAQLAVLFVQVVAKVTNMKNGIVKAFLRLFLKSRQRLRVVGAHVTINGQFRRPVGRIRYRYEIENTGPSQVTATAVV